MGTRAYSHQVFSDSDTALSLGITFQAACDASVSVGDAVRFSSGSLVQAQADVLANSWVVGLVESKESSTLCTVRTCGLTPDNYSGLSENSEYFLSATVAGEMTTTVPTGSGTVILRVSRAVTSTSVGVFLGTPIVRT